MPLNLCQIVLIQMLYRSISRNIMRDDGLIVFILAGYLMFLPGLVAYLALRKRYAFEPHVFWYNIGFTACFVIFMLGAEFITIPALSVRESYEVLLVFYTIASPLISSLIYYSYAALLHTKDDRINKTIVYLTAGLGVLPATVFIIEIANGRLSIVGFVLFAYAAYLILCTIYEKFRVSLRLMAWSLFLPMIVVIVFITWMAFALSFG